MFYYILYRNSGRSGPLRCSCLTKNCYWKPVSAPTTGRAVWCVLISLQIINLISFKTCSKSSIIFFFKLAWCCNPLPWTIVGCLQSRNCMVWAEFQPPMPTYEHKTKVWAALHTSTDTATRCPGCRTSPESVFYTNTLSIHTAPTAPANMTCAPDLLPLGGTEALNTT